LGAETGELPIKTEGNEAKSSAHARAICSDTPLQVEAAMGRQSDLPEARAALLSFWVRPKFVVNRDVLTNP